MKINRLFFIPIIYCGLFACAQDKNPVNTEHTHEIIISGLSIPWSFVFLPDGDILVAEKEGLLLKYHNGFKTPIKNLPQITVLGQGGLMDIELHPNFKENGWIYLAYASTDKNGNGANTTIMRAKLIDDTLIDKQVLYKATPDTSKGQHFGCRMVFDENNYLYFSIGDRGDRDTNPQDVTRDGGKIYRIHDDGKIPADNPFVHVPNAKKAIYTYGHRNPQGLAFNPVTKELWENEHGPKGGDEINIIEPNNNYGWPLATFGKNYSGTTISKYTTLPGMEQPIHYWNPSIAPCGMTFITSNVYPNWKNHLLVGSLKFQYLNLITLKANKIVNEQRLIDGLGRVRSVEISPDGYIYAGVENVGIVKIIPKK